jgi:hypothetical protein
MRQNPRDHMRTGTVNEATARRDNLGFVSVSFVSLGSMGEIITLWIVISRKLSWNLKARMTRIDAEGARGQ